MSDALRIRGLGGIRSRGLLLWSGCEDDFQEPEKFAHLRARDDEGRQQAQRKIVGTIDQQAALHGLGDERPTFGGELDANHQAFATDLANKIESCSKLCQTFAQLGTARPDIFEELFVLDDSKKFKRGGASQRAAAKGGA